MNVLRIYIEYFSVFCYNIGKKNERNDRMSAFTKITPQELTDNPFTLIGKEWALVTAGTTIQHHDRQLGRRRHTLEQAGDLHLHPSAALHLWISGKQRLLLDVLL